MKLNLHCLSALTKHVVGACIFFSGKKEHEDLEKESIDSDVPLKTARGPAKGGVTAFLSLFCSVAAVVGETLR